MARTKIPSAAREEEDVVPVDEKLRGEWPLEDDDSMADAQLKKKAAVDRNKFISRWVEQQFASNWAGRQVVAGKPPRMADLEHIAGFRTIMDNQRWSALFNVDEYRPGLVQLFFANMVIGKDDEGEMVVRSYVLGREVHLRSSDFNTMFDMGYSDAFKVSTLSKEAAEVELEAAVRYLCRGEGRNLNAMTLCARCVSFVVCQFVQGRAGKELTEYDYILTHKAMTGVQIDLGDVVFFNLELTANSSNRKLPYGTILTALFEMLGIPTGDLPVVRVRQFFSKKNLASIMGKRKMMGHDDDDDGNEDETEGAAVGGLKPGEEGAAKGSSVKEEVERLRVSQEALLEKLQRQRARDKKFRAKTKSKLKGIMNLLKELVGQPRK